MLLYSSVKWTYDKMNLWKQQGGIYYLLYYTYYTTTKSRRSFKNSISNETIREYHRKMRGLTWGIPHCAYALKRETNQQIYSTNYKEKLKCGTSTRDYNNDDLTECFHYKI